MVQTLAGPSSRCKWKPVSLSKYLKLIHQVLDKTCLSSYLENILCEMTWQARFACRILDPPSSPRHMVMQGSWSPVSALGHLLFLPPASLHWEMPRCGHGEPPPHTHPLQTAAPWLPPGPGLCITAQCPLSRTGLVWACADPGSRLGAVWTANSGILLSWAWSGGKAPGMSPRRHASQGCSQRQSTEGC